jgi:acyl-CoA thioesterase-1
MKKMSDLGAMNVRTPSRLIMVVWTCIWFAGCRESVDGPGDDAQILNQENLTYLALGDSYTIGESVDESGRWPNQLVDSLNLRDLGPDSRLDRATIVATTGWTTANLLAGIESSQVDTATWDLVSLLIGVNNQYQGRSVEEYAAEFSTLLDRCLALAGGRDDRVFVVSIPDYGFTPFGSANQTEISAQLASFNDTCRAITWARGLAYYNITPISQQWPQWEGLVAPDGLHPSAYQYSLWVSTMVDEVAASLQP